MKPDDLKQWRADLRLSQQAAARALGVSLKTFQTWERGADFETGKPSGPSVMCALACAALRRKIPPEGSD